MSVVGHFQHLLGGERVEYQAVTDETGQGIQFSVRTDPGQDPKPFRIQVWGETEVWAFAHNGHSWYSYRKLNPDLVLDREYVLMLSKAWAKMPEVMKALGKAWPIEKRHVQTTSYGRCVLVTGTYGDATCAITLVGLEKEFAAEQIAKLTVSVEGAELGVHEILVKTWSENEEIAKDMLNSGWFEDTGRRVKTGYVEAQVWRVFL